MGISRRDFLKVAGVGAGVAVAAGYSPVTYAQKSKLRVGMIGTGGQGSLHLRDGLAHLRETIQVVATCDVYRPHLDGGVEEYLKSVKELQKGRDYEGTIPKYMDYREMLDKEQLDAVVISTPLNTHFQIVMDCLSAGKHVFCEKTMCYSVEQCRQVVQKCHETGLFVQVGHQRRYNPLYNKSMWLALEDKMRMIGRISHITAQWHRNNDWRRPIDPNYVLSDEEKKFITTDLEHHLNWRLYDEYSAGGLMTELGSHQLDVANWFLNTPPKRVMGSGGIDYWKDGRNVYDNVALVYDYELTPANARGFGVIDKRNPFQDMRKINQPYTVRCTYTSICDNAQRGASELMQGDRGTLELTEQACYVYAEDAAKVAWDSGGITNAASVSKAVTSGTSLTLSNQAYENRIAIKVANDKTVDTLQFQSFADDVMRKTTPKANQMVGLMAAATVLAGVKAMKENTIVEIDPAQWTFDFPTPDPYRYEYWPRWEPWDENP